MGYNRDEKSRSQDPSGENSAPESSSDQPVPSVVDGPTPPPPGPAQVGYPDAPPPTSPMSVMAFVLGLLGIIVTLITGCFCAPLAIFGGALSIAAWVLGHVERKRALAGGEVPSGLATAGWILGIIGTILAIIWIVMTVALVALGITMETMKPGGGR